MNALRLTTATSTTTTAISTGSARNARRVPARFAREALNELVKGARLEVQTARGWEARRIVKVGAAFYTRCV